MLALTRKLRAVEELAALEALVGRRAVPRGAPNAGDADEIQVSGRVTAVIVADVDDLVITTAGETLPRSKTSAKTQPTDDALRPTPAFAVISSNLPLPRFLNIALTCDW